MYNIPASSEARIQISLIRRSALNPLKYRTTGAPGGGRAMVLDKLPVPGRPTNLDQSRARPTVLTEGAGGGCLDIFSLIYHVSFLFPSLWETARYRLKYCLKGPLSPKQPTNQPGLLSLWETARYRLRYCLDELLNS